MPDDHHQPSVGPEVGTGGGNGDPEVDLHEVSHHRRDEANQQKLIGSALQCFRLWEQKSAQDERVICPHCYMSLAEFKRVGRFGCSQCVTTFDEHIKSLIKQIHQSDRHVGRKPAPGEKKGLEVYKLREELKKALEKEAYEDAARIRDKLKGYGIEDA